MSGANPLVGLIGNYESGSDSEAESEVSKPAPPVGATASTPVTHPAPISHCPWSACYDEGSGYTYYWHQLTNEVTWEAPPEYLLALKLASQKLASPAQGEVTADEWRLYQLALAENQASKAGPKPAAPSLGKPGTKIEEKKHSNIKKRRGSSDSEDEKIELITSYYNSDSDSEPENPVQPKSNQEPIAVAQPAPVAKPTPKVTKKLTKKPKAKPLEYGPTLPPNQEYTVPIGPELPPEYQEVDVKSSGAEVESQAADVSKDVETTETADVGKAVAATETADVSKTVKCTEIGVEEKSNGTSIETDNADSQDEHSLMQELLNKAKILEKLGGELPTDLKKLIKPISQKSSRATSPDTSNHIDDASRGSRSTTVDTNIDDLLEEIEKKELPKRLQPKKTIEKIDMFSDDANFPSNDFEDLVTKTVGSASVLKSEPDVKPDVKQEIKTLFPSSKELVIEPSSLKTEEPLVVSGSNCLFPSATHIETAVVTSVTPPLEVKPLEPVSNVALEKKGENMYICTAEGMEPMPKKRKRISSNVLPEPKKSEVPSYTTKYSQYIDGFSNERTGLGFSKNNDESEEPVKKSFSYGNYARQGVMMFTKGETLNEEKVEKVNPSEKEKVESLSDILESKLKFLNQQSIAISPVQEMTIQMQSLGAAHAVGALTAAYWRGWLAAASGSLARLEAAAAPPGWQCQFHREEGRYGYRREWDGHTQWEYPEAGGLDDMDICTTPPPPPAEPPPPDAAPPPPAPVPPPAAAVAAVPPSPPPPLPPPPAPAPATSAQITIAPPPAKKARGSPPPLPAEPPPPPPAWAPQPPPPPPPTWAPQPQPQPPPPPPPPPAWRDAASPPPPPPGCEDDHEHAAPPPPPPPPDFKQRSPSPPKRESLGDELLSFYSDIAELEKQSEPEPPPPPPPAPLTAPANLATPATPAAPPAPDVRSRERAAEEKSREANGTPKPTKKKTKVKISAGMGIKHKTVSNLVAKWQQVQEEINSD